MSGLILHSRPIWTRKLGTILTGVCFYLHMVTGELSCSDSIGGILVDNPYNTDGEKVFNQWTWKTYKNCDSLARFSDPNPETIKLECPIPIDADEQYDVDKYVIWFEEDNSMWPEDLSTYNLEKCWESGIGNQNKDSLPRIDSNGGVPDALVYTRISPSNSRTTGYGTGNAESRGISMDANNSLIIPNGLQSDTGNYTCIYYVFAEPTLCGNPCSVPLYNSEFAMPYHCANVHMSIQESANYYQTAGLGNEVHLQCPINPTSPLEQVRWFVKQSLPEQCENLDDLTEDYKGDPVTGSLWIPRVRRSDDGDYVCVLGNTCKQTTLWVTETWIGTMQYSYVEWWRPSGGRLSIQSGLYAGVNPFPDDFDIEFRILDASLDAVFSNTSGYGNSEVIWRMEGVEYTDSNNNANGNFMARLVRFSINTRISAAYTKYPLQNIIRNNCLQYNESEGMGSAVDNFTEPCRLGTDQAYFMMGINKDTIEVNRQEAEAFTQGEFLLSGQASATAGNVEVYWMKKWGPVCKDGFGINEANMICRQMGYVYAASYFTSTNMGIIVDPMNNLQCPSSAVDINDCTYDDLRTTTNANCEDSEYVGVKCYEKEQWQNYTTTECSPNNNRGAAWAANDWHDYLKTDATLEECKQFCVDLGAVHCHGVVHRVPSYAWGSRCFLIKNIDLPRCDRNAENHVLYILQDAPYENSSSTLNLGTALWVLILFTVRSNM